MSVIPIGHQTLNRADIAAIITRGRTLGDQRRFGDWLPVATEDGDLIVAAMSNNNQDLVFGFGKEEGWYYAFNAAGELLAEGRLLEELFAALAREFKLFADAF